IRGCPPRRFAPRARLGPGASDHLGSAAMTEVPIRIRWRDVDNYGHVNNAVYLTYLEEARDRWVRDTLGPDVNFVIVRVPIDYPRELSLDDEEVIVTCRGAGYGTSSI